MRQILHVADLHQGLRTHGRPDARGINSAVSSVARSWQELVRLTLEQHVKVEAIVVAGDAFHGPNPDAVEIEGFMRGVRIAREAEVPVLAISGNHDRAPHPYQPAILDALHSPPWLYGVTRPGVVELPGGLRIACLPSIGRAQLAATRDGSRAALEQEVVDALRTILDGLRAQDSDLLTLHYSIAGSVLSTEADISLIPEPMLAPADLEGLGYVAAGHIHKSQVIVSGALTDKPLASLAIGAYAGSIDRISFSEAEETKGGWLVDLDQPPSSAVWLENAVARRFSTLIYTGGELDAGASDVEGAILRLRGRAADRAGLIRLRGQLLDLGAESVRIEVEPERQTQARAPEIAEAGPSVPEALRLWLERREELSPSRRQNLRKLAETLSE